MNGVVLVDSSDLADLSKSNLGVLLCELSHMLTLIVVAAPVFLGVAMFSAESIITLAGEA